MRRFQNHSLKVSDCLVSPKNSRNYDSRLLDPWLNSFSLSFLSLVKNCNHKGLGIYYLLSAFIFGISGTLISVLIRIELYSSGNRIISPENQNFYNISITLHGFHDPLLSVSLLFTGYPQDFLESIIQAVFILFLIFLSFT